MASLQSMTGYGKGEKEGLQNKYIVEIRSLNSKQLDVSCRISSLLREKEIEIRNSVSEKLLRGKIDIFVNTESGKQGSNSLNSDLIKNYFKQISELSKDMGLPVDNQLLSAVLRFPDVVQSKNEEINDAEWAHLNDALIIAIQEITKHRISEGQCLYDDLVARIHFIIEKIPLVITMGEERIMNVRNRIDQAMAELKERSGNDPNRFEQELIFYIEKMDFSEEITRLEHHCKYFIETMHEDAPGKKLGFIAQELGREINTLGSKAYHVGIQKIVVEMKDELEKIKEQLANVL